MKRVKQWLTFFRLPNLVIVALTMYLIRWAVLWPFLERATIELELTAWEFAGLVLATVLVTLNGYLINDYYDQETDKLNKPDKAFVGKLISAKNCLVFWWISTFLGGTLSLFVALSTDNLLWFSFYPMAAILLWGYARWWKGTPAIGNFIVSAFCSGVPLLVIFSERAAFEALAVQPTLFDQLSHLAIGYAGFAFLSNFYREIIKDLEDEEGDRQSGYRTLTVVWGRKKTLLLVHAFAVLLIIGVLTFLFTKTVLTISELVWAAVMLIFPLFRNFRLLSSNPEKAGFHHASQRTKWIMLSGLILMVLSALG